MAGEDLIRYGEAQAAIEPYRFGGLIQGALSTPENSMNRIIEEHLGRIAMLNARGDTVPERPTYIFDPESGLLINFAYRRDPEPMYEGLFADIVELDENGRPRYGVGMVDPLATKTGFIHVAVGDNEFGFAPSYTEFKVDDDEPTQTVPPNISTADLLAMLSQKPIAVNETLAEFLARQQRAREEFRHKVSQRQSQHYRGTQQSFGERINPDFHLIVSDSEDPQPLIEASREVGIYPLLVTGDQLLDAYAHLLRLQRAKRGFSAHEVGTQRVIMYLFPELEEWAKDNNISFITIDLHSDKNSYLNEATKAYDRVQVDLDDGSGKARGRRVGRGDALHNFIRSLLNNSRFFSAIDNIGYEYGDDNVVKNQHGRYQLALNTQDQEVMQNYTDWLRKVKLDMLLTLYLRGLNQL